MAANQRLHWYLAVYVGSDQQGWTEDPNAGRIESRMWDMLRYDRCYPASNAERWNEMGFVLLKQPYQQDTKGGFTFGRWKSLGFHILEEGPASLSGSPSMALEDRCRHISLEMKKRREAAANAR